MNLFLLYKVSLLEPKKQAAARIMPIGKILQFVFSFILLLTVVSFINLLNGLAVTTADLDGLLRYIEEIEWLLYPFALLALFVSTTAVHFVKISLFAFVAMGFIYIRKKKGEYRHLWRTAALAVTGPTLLSLVLSFFGAGPVGSVLSVSLTVLLLWLDIRFYPNLPPVRAKTG